MRHRIRAFNYAHLLFSALILVMSVAPLRAEDVAKPPVVVELFTSQGCYSCPPAEAYLGQLAKRADVIALEFHVDYWDDLVYGSAGKWKDPFSSPQHTLRQRSYNLNIRKTGGVYTPQMVIDGRWETVGSHQHKVEAAIARSRKMPNPPLTLELDARDTQNIDIHIDGSHPDSATVWLVQFYRTIETRVRSGENKGKTLTSHHIVSNVQPIGEWAGNPLSLSVAVSGAGPRTGCAVLVQATPASPILGAAYCPGDVAS